MKSALYFAHDYHARNDEKSLFLIAHHGVFGYGVFWCLVEMMHESGNGTINLDLIEGVSSSLKVETDQLGSVINTCIKAGLFVKEDNLIRSNRVLSNLNDLDDYREKRAEAGRKGGIAKRENRSKSVAKLELATLANKQNVADKTKVNKSNYIYLASHDAKVEKEADQELKVEPITEPIQEHKPTLKDLYASMGLPKPVRVVSKWQDEASAAIQLLQTPKEKVSSVFKCFRENNEAAKFALSDCKELGKHNCQYFFKVYSENLKKYAKTTK